MCGSNGWCACSIVYVANWNLVLFWSPLTLCVFVVVRLHQNWFHFSRMPSILNSSRRSDRNHHSPKRTNDANQVVLVFCMFFFSFIIFVTTSKSHRSPTFVIIRFVDFCIVFRISNIKTTSFRGIYTNANIRLFSNCIIPSVICMIYVYICSRFMFAHYLGAILCFLTRRIVSFCVCDWSAKLTFPLNRLV